MTSTLQRMKVFHVFVVLIAMSLFSGCISTRSAAKVQIEAKVKSVDNDGMVLHSEVIGVFSSGTIDSAVLSTIEVLSPQRYAGRVLMIRLSVLGSKEPMPGAAALARVDTKVRLEVLRNIFTLSPEQVADFAAGGIRVLE